MRFGLLALASCTLVAACAPRAIVRTAPPRPLADAWGLAVYPVVFRFPVSGYESFERGRAVAEQLSARTGRLVYGPGEFRVDARDEDRLDRGTNLLSALRFSKERRPEALYGVRVIVEQRVTTATRQAYDSSGRLRGASAEQDVEVAVRVQVLSAYGPVPVVEVEGTAHADPFTADLERDPYPDVTKLTRELVEEAATAAGWAAATRPDAGLETIPVPKPALAYAFGGRSLAQELEALDALEQDARFLRLMRARDPDAPRPRLRLYRTAPTGLVVLSVGGAAREAGLLPEDLLVSADGEALTGRHVLDRHLVSGRSVLKVRRAGEELDVALVLRR